VVVILVDYLSAATRRDAPTERKSKANTPEFKGFRHVTAAFLSYFAPRTLFKNRLVLPGKSETRMSPPYNNFGDMSHLEKRKDNVKKKKKTKNKEEEEKKKKKKQKKMKKKKKNVSKNHKGSKRDRRKFKTQRDRKRAYSGEENQKEDNALSTLSSEDIDFGDLDFSVLH
jgi:hypothetical protein